MGPDVLQALIGAQQLGSGQEAGVTARTPADLAKIPRPGSRRRATRTGQRSGTTAAVKNGVGRGGPPRAAHLKAST